MPRGELAPSVLERTPTSGPGSTNRHTLSAFTAPPPPKCMGARCACGHRHSGASDRRQQGQRRTGRVTGSHRAEASHGGRGQGHCRLPLKGTTGNRSSRAQGGSLPRGGATHPQRHPGLRQGHGLHPDRRWGWTVPSGPCRCDPMCAGPASEGGPRAWQRGCLWSPEVTWSIHDTQSSGGPRAQTPEDHHPHPTATNTCGCTTPPPYPPPGSPTPVPRQTKKWGPSDVTASATWRTSGTGLFKPTARAQANIEERRGDGGGRVWDPKIPNNGPITFSEL